MSWVYWGIVIGVVLLLTVFIVGTEIMYRAGRASARGTTGSSAGTSQEAGSGTKHAA